MVYNYPYFHYPNYSSYPYGSPSTYYRNRTSRSNNEQPEYPQESRTIKEKKKEEEKTEVRFLPSGEKEEPFFNIFGISLYFDDILLLCLIFFLYKEGVKDQYLFISLILLLLS